MPLNAGPSQGFFGKLAGGFGKMGKNLKKNAPAMVNAAGQQFGGPVFGNTSRITAPMLNRGNKKSPLPSTPIDVPPTGTPDVQPNPPIAAPGLGGGPGAGIVRGPQFGFGGMNPPGGGFGMGGRFGGGMGRPGVGGGMFGGGGTLPFPQATPDADMGNGVGGGLWGAYNNLSAQQVPNRQLFY